MTQNHSSTPSNKCFNEACQKLAQTLPKNDGIILANMGQLALEENFSNLIPRLIERTTLSRKEIVESLKRLRRDKVMLESLRIQTIAEEIE